MIVFMEQIFQNKRKIIGVRETTKAIKKDIVSQVVFAKDAASDVIDPILKECNKKSIQIQEFGTMKELGEICGIRVGAAVVALLKD